MLRTDRRSVSAARVFTDPVVWLAMAMFLSIGVLLFPGAGPDDAYMTFWVADVLSRHGDILNYNGDAVEQSSSVGFVVAIALVQWLTGLEASVVGRFLAVGFGLATILATASVMRSLGGPVGRAAAALVASSSYFVSWSFAGMECTLAALAGTLLVLLTAKVLDEGPSPRRLAAAAGLTMAYVSSRPESMFILGATLGGVVAVLWLHRAMSGTPTGSDKTLTQRVLPLVAVCLATIAIVIALRLWKFGLIFPEPVYAKSGLSKSRILQGLHYLVEGSTDNGKRISEFVLVPLVALIGAARFVASGVESHTRSWLLPVCGLFLMANLGFIVLIGGDGMPGGRFFLPVIPVAAILSAALLQAWLRPRAFSVTTPLWVALQVGGTLVFAGNESLLSSYPLWAVPDPIESGGPGRFNWFERMNHSHRRYMPAVAVLEEQVRRIEAHKRPVLILSGQSGFVMYQVVRAHPGILRYLDRFGLVTRDFRQCSVSAAARRTVWGLEIEIERYLFERDTFRRACGISPPDIIYDLFEEESFLRELEQRLNDAGYTLAYVQVPELIPRSNYGRAYIAVRQLAMPK